MYSKYLITDTNVYLVTSTSTNTSTAPIDLTAKCDPRDFVLNGGYSFSGGIGILALTIISVNEPITSPAGGGWHAVLEQPGENNKTFTVKAYCFDNSPPN